MDAGVVNSIENDNYHYKFGAPAAGDVRTAEAQDDGYETSNGGEGQPAPPPAAPPPPAPSPLAAPPSPSAAPPAMDSDEPPQGEPAPPPAEQPENSEPKPDEPEKEEERLDEVDGHLEKVDKETPSASNSPKTVPNDVLNEDSSASIRDNIPSSPCASNSRSNSSLGRQQIPYRDGVDLSANLSTMPVQEDREDSSSQSQSYPINATMEHQMNPYDMKQRMPQQYMPVRGPEMPFGALKREPYDMSTAEHDPYAHYKRENDPYSRENIDPYRNQYKRPEEMFMNSYKEEMPYSGFGIKRDMNPYYNASGQFGLKREHDPDVLGYNGIKRECSEDPYSFVDEEAAVCAMLGQQGNPAMGNPGNPLHPDMLQQHLMQSAPKKRGRKKKIKDECPDIKQEACLEGQLGAVKPVKERKKHDRFNGMPEEEVCRRTLPDHLAQNLDIIIIGINPGLFAAYKGHHYAGPGNHFWKCLYLSGLTQEQMSADEDYKLLHFGIGFTNMVQRATKGSADLTRKEIKEGSQILLEKLQTYRPKIAVFNGKLIYEVFSGKKDFCFGRQPDTVHGTNTYMWVMPSSSARCAQLPRAADKVPFYSALRRFRDYLNGTLAHVDDAELVFPDTTCRREREENEIRRLLGPDTPCEMMVLEDGTEVPVKKKRGRPKKVKLENGEVAPPAPRAPRAPRQPQPPAEGLNGEQPPKKKRGRPKKVRPEEQFQGQNPVPLVTQPLPNMPLNQQLNLGQGMDTYPQGLLGSRDYSQSALGMEGGMMYQGNQSMSGGNSVPVNVPATSPYFSQDDQGSLGGVRSQPGYGQSPGPFSQSPRPQGGYSSSPRPAGYSQSPQRHQMGYSNSPAHPQSLPFSQSPVPQSAHYSQSPPLRPHSQNHNYSQQSPVPGHPYSRSPVPQNNPSNYSQQSPMFAQSPAMPHPYSQSPVPQNQRYSQPSPVSQNMAYACRSPGPMGHSYPSSPLPQGTPYPQLSPRGNQSHPYSQSPIPQNSNIYAHPQIMSPAPQPQGYGQGAPYSHGGYGQSPAHQPQSRPGAYGQSPPRGQSLPNPSLSQQRQYHSDLSSEISAAISSPGPASPGIGHIDFEPPILDGQIAAREADNSSSRSVSQRTSPGGEQLSSQQNPANLDALNAMGDMSHASSHDSNDLMDSCANSMMQMSSNRQIGNQNRHSALNLIGPSSSSNTSSPIPDATKPGVDMSRSSQQVYGAMYNQPGSNEAQSPVSNEQRLGFQVPTPSGSANSSYGTAADLSGVTRHSPREVDNASVASVASQERLGGNYALGAYAEGAGSPRQPDSGGLLAHHAASMYHSNPFSRMGSTPPSQPPFSQGGGAFRGLPLDHSSPQQGPVDYGSPVKPSPGTTKQQDVSSKSLSGLESLVDQIPSIAEGGPAPAPEPPAPPALDGPYAPLYSPYPYQPAPYAPPAANAGYAGGGFVGYPGGYGQLMRPTPGYLPEALGAYHPGYPGQYAYAAPGPAAPAPNYSYYNGYPPAIPNAAANMPTYLTSHVLDHIHKNAAADASSVSFGGFC